MVLLLRVFLRRLKPLYVGVDQMSDRPPPQIPSTLELSTAAADLAAASNELTKSIAPIEEFLGKLALGVPAWVKVKGWVDDYGGSWRRELGYDLISGEWHLAIRETAGSVHNPDNEDVSTWKFSSAPRKSRISSVDHIPELLSELIKESATTAKKMRAKSTEVATLAAALKPAKKA